MQLATPQHRILAIEKEIVAAKDLGRNEDVATLEIKKQQLKTAQALDAYLHPEKYDADRANARRVELQKRDFDEHGGLRNVVRDGSGNVIGGMDDLTGETRLNGGGSRKMSSPADRASSFEKERYRQEHVYDKVTGSAIKEDPSNLLDFDNFFGSDAKDRRKWMDDDFKMPRRSAAEQNRPNAPLKPLPAVESPLEGKITTLIASLDKIASKIGVFA